MYQREYRKDTGPRGADTPNPGAGLSTGLGWFSIALGVVELVAPHAVAQVCGMRPGNASTVRLYGLREIATGIGILRARNAAPWLWARVAGDMVDMVTLAATADKGHVKSLAKAGAAMSNVAAVTALDVWAAQTYKQPATRRAGVDFADYSDRAGFPGSPDSMRGEARKDFQAPRDMRTPQALRPWGQGDEDRKVRNASARSPRSPLHTIEAESADAVAPQGLVDKV